MTPAQLVEASRFPRMIEGEWTQGAISTIKLGPWTIGQRLISRGAQEVPQGLQPGDRHTILFRYNEAGMHLAHGEVVMDDSPQELRRHLPILLRARGRVLVTGLGLGCVVRGLLVNPDVEHVDVVENDSTILGWVGPEFLDEPRVTLHLGDALTFEWPEGAEWDFAWHDLHCDEGKLALLHVEALAHYRDRVPRQGAWGLPRYSKRILRGTLPGFIE